MRRFYEENKNYCIAFAVVVVLCIAGIWMVHDYYRSESIYEDTNVILDGIDKRIKNAGKRIDSVTESVGKAEKTVTDAVGRIERSQESAGKIASGIDECESRLDSVIQRQGRITNLVTEIERINK